MQHDPLVLCEDILAAIQVIRLAVGSAGPEVLGRDLVCRAAVERSFEIIGEAVHRWERSDPVSVTHIHNYARIIGFRNKIAHGYDVVDLATMADIILRHLPRLEGDVRAMLATAPPTDQGPSHA